MAGVYRPRHPERTVLYRVLFHYFDRFLAEYKGRFEKELLSPEWTERILSWRHTGFSVCGGLMKVIAFLTDYAVVDRIVGHLKLTFVAERPPPHFVYQEVLVAGAEYSS
jgi:hypothetical protein